jgi:hypothetical protein
LRDVDEHVGDPEALAHVGLDPREVAAERRDLDAGEPEAREPCVPLQVPVLRPTDGVLAIPPAP